MEELWTPSGITLGMDRAEVAAQQELDAATAGVAKQVKRAGQTAEGMTRWAQGTVSAVTLTSTTYTVDVTMADSTVIAGVDCLNSTPLVNDGVWIVNIGKGRWLCLGSTIRSKSWTPTVKINTTNIAIGNGSLTGHYTVTNNWCSVEANLAWGSTSSCAGTGAINFWLPISAADGYAGSAGRIIGTVSYLNPGVWRGMAFCRVDVGGNNQYVYGTNGPVMGGGEGVMTDTSPFNMKVAAATLAWSLHYRVA